MMSTPPVAIQRQRLHRRQNSTPVAFDGMKAPSLPPTTQRQNSHRRGQSLDNQRSPIRRHNHTTGSTVSIANLESTPQGQQILREAQQQKVARPGQRLELSLSPQCGLFPLNTQFSPDPLYHNATTMNAILQNSGNMQIAHSPFYAHDVSMPMSAGYEGMGFGFDENSQHYFQSCHTMTPDIGDGMIDTRRMSQPELHMHAEQRPITPSQQMSTARFPLTPAATPFKQNPAALQYSRSAQSSPMKRYAEKAINAPAPVSMQRGRSLEGIFESREFEHETMTPPGTAPLLSTNGFDMAEMPVPEHMSSHPGTMTFLDKLDSYISTHDSPASAFSQNHASPQPSPQIEKLPFFDETGGEAPNISSQPIPVLSSTKVESSRSNSPGRTALSPRRMSISDLNLEPGISASIEETNITLDDIAQFIDGPDPEDNKWICKFEDCNKRFGRKENIKSHVQTHLGDRQFRCDHCNKCFVRGHDLKRHAKIHTGTKPYPCACGNAFARHDALTRHRQRGMCIGAFDGVVKKVIKRGRPRKHRPEMDERIDKANRTRRGLSERENQYASSASSCSISSWDSPPTETFESLSIRGGSPFDEMTLFGGSQPHLSMENIALPPDLFTFTPPASPGYSTGNKPSPQHHAMTPTEVADIPELPSSPTPIVPALLGQHSHHTPPSLSHSSSSPAADLVAFDFSEDPTTTVQRMALKMDHERSLPGADFDNFLDYGNIGLDTSTDSFFDVL